MVKILDVSHYQNQAGPIDWAKVRAAGYEAVYIKATEALTSKDAYYTKNISDARKAGFVVGSYHFARANDATKEADFFLSVVGQMQDYDFLVLDWEIEASDPDGWCRTFLDRCFEKTGVRPLLYTNEDRVVRINWKKVVAGNYGLIAAKYGDNDAVLEDNEIAKSDEFPFVAIQQFTSNMTVPGVTGRVDANVGNLTIEALKKYGKQPAQPAPAEPDKEEIGDALKKALVRCGASDDEMNALGDNFDAPKDGDRMAAIVNRKVDALEKRIAELEAQPAPEQVVTPAKVEPELAAAVKYAHDIELGEYFSPESQRLVAERETELKKSEMRTREMLGNVREIVNANQ